MAAWLEPLVALTDDGHLTWAAPTPRATGPLIVSDFDSTLFPLIPAIAKLPGYEQVADHPILAWMDLAAACGSMQRMLDAFDLVMCEEIQREHGLYPNAQPALERLRDNGARIIVVTDRPHRAAGEAALATLHEQGVPLDGFACGPFDRVALAVQMGAALLIDDRPDTLVRAAEAGLACAALEHDYNVDEIRRARAHSAPDWHALEPLLHAHLELPTPRASALEL